MIEIGKVITEEDMKLFKKQAEGDGRAFKGSVDGLMTEVDHNIIEYSGAKNIHYTFKFNKELNKLDSISCIEDGCGISDPERLYVHSRSKHKTDVHGDAGFKLAMLDVCKSYEVISILEDGSGWITTDVTEKPTPYSNDDSKHQGMHMTFVPKTNIYCSPTKWKLETNSRTLGQIIKNIRRRWRTHLETNRSVTLTFQLVDHQDKVIQTINTNEKISDYTVNGGFAQFESKHLKIDVHRLNDKAFDYPQGGGIILEYHCADGVVILDPENFSNEFVGKSSHAQYNRCLIRVFEKQLGLFSPVPQKFLGLDLTQETTDNLLAREYMKKVWKVDDNGVAHEGIRKYAVKQEVKDSTIEKTHMHPAVRTALEHGRISHIPKVKSEDISGEFKVNGTGYSVDHIVYDASKQEYHLIESGIKIRKKLDQISKYFDLITQDKKKVGSITIVGFCNHLNDNDRTWLATIEKKIGTKVNLMNIDDHPFQYGRDTPIPKEAKWD